jgi:hypothetical protein
VWRLAAWPLRIAQIRGLFTDAWRHRHNIAFADATYVALAEHLNAFRCCVCRPAPEASLAVRHKAASHERPWTVADKGCSWPVTGCGRGILAG